MDVHRQIIAGMASLAALYAGSSHALGLGELQLESALSQPLRGVITLHGAQGLTPADVRISLADAEAFARVGIERPHFLTDLRFTPVMLNQQLAVRVESSRPVNEPYLNFLVQLHRPGGLLLREYTLLLDPPLYQPTPILATTVTPASMPAAVAPPVSSAPAQPRPQPSLPTLQPQPGAGRYQTAAGDSLWAIAASTRADSSVPVRTQMLAIRALNPAAFIDGDIDRLRTGQTLTLPTAQQVGASPAAASAGQTTPGSTRLAAVTPDAAPATALPDQQDRLRIEEPLLQATALENEELKNRLGVLESRFNTLLTELDARDRQIASLQAELDVMRRARDAQLQLAAAAPQTEVGEADRFSVAPPQAGVMAASSDSPVVAGALQSSMSAAEAAPAAGEPRSSIMNWWPALLALLVVLAGAILLRLRRGLETELVVPVASPAPQPVTIPGSKTADPLEGVELYITYGRLVEARDMLDKAISAEPQRVDLRQRQLAVLAELGDAVAFAEQQAVVLELGGDRARVDQLKARFPQLEQVRTRQQAQVEPVQEPSVAIPDEAADVAALDLDSFDLDADWDLIEQLDSDNTKRHVGGEPAVEEPFESNLNDFPEVGELDEAFAGHFTPSADSRGSN
ncbi:FimV family protein [Pseudomonas sp. MYb185]|uniref:type IV pilus assembly protein FimV n=1 Tax=Pseudomonas sp. MYb185 TaxID=1848729 RepID=UPI000CFB93BB|nr:FimV/HubP family polar landmark protein [Pseudomonas sp. MYb185]PRB82171.1 hypothetical protein CQ007_08405 [Pseudomonas sp. MYb185]